MGGNRARARKGSVSSDDVRHRCGQGRARAGRDLGTCECGLCSHHLISHLGQLCCARSLTWRREKCLVRDTVSDAARLRDYGVWKQSGKHRRDTGVQLEKRVQYGVLLYLHPAGLAAPAMHGVTLLCAACGRYSVLHLEPVEPVELTRAG